LLMFFLLEGVLRAALRSAVVSPRLPIEPCDGKVRDGVRLALALGGPVDSEATRTTLSGSGTSPPP
jgi:hypothetical protein